MRTIERALTDEGPQTRLQLRERLERAGVPVEGQALVHLLFLATLRGIAVRGPTVGKEHAYALVRDCLGEQAPVDREQALAELARRYLVGHAPADDRDLARWAGLPLRDARVGLAAISSQLVEREDGLLQLKKTPKPAPIPPPMLIGSYDPVLLGWTSREEIVGPHEFLVTNNGLFRPFAMVKGKAVATWRLAGGKVTIEQLGKVRRKDAHALDEDAERVREFFGLS